MTERERRTSTGGTEDNVKDDLKETQERDEPGQAATTGAVEEEEATGGSTGGMKDNVKDDQRKTQRR